MTKELDVSASKVFQLDLTDNRTGQYFIRIASGQDTDTQMVTKVY